MSPDGFDLLLAACSPGARIEIECKGADGPVRSSGVLLRFDSDGLFLDSGGYTEFVSRDILTRFKITHALTSVPVTTDQDLLVPVVVGGPSGTQEPESKSPPMTAEAGRLVSVGESIGPPPLILEPESPANDTIDSPQHTPVDESESPAPPANKILVASDDDPRWPLLFAARPQIEAPEPNFSTIGLDVESLDALVRAKSRYEYAVKISDLGRVRADLAALLRRAAATKIARLFTLAGVLAMKLNDLQKAHKCLAHGAELNDPAASYALAFLAIKEEQWVVAAQSILSYLALRPELNGSDFTLLQTLGRCLYRAENRQVPGIAELARRALGSPLGSLAVDIAALAGQPLISHLTSEPHYSNRAKLDIETKSATTTDDSPTPPDSADKPSPTLRDSECATADFRSPTDDSYWHLVFNGLPQLAPPEPDFRTDGLDRDSAELLVRAHVRYEYASEVNQLDRIRCDIAPLMRQASAVYNARLFTIAGTLALKLNDVSTAMQAFTLGDELSDYQAAYGLATLAIAKGHWRPAAEKIIRCLLLKSNLTADDLDLAENLGRCLNQMENREVPGIAAFVRRSAGTPLAEVATVIGSFALHSRPESAALIRVGQVESARAAAPDSVVFTDGAVLQARITSLERFRSSVTTPQAQNVSGRITAFYPQRNFGFIFADNSGRTYHFSFDTVEDSSLRSALLDNRTGQKVVFNPSPSSVPGARYPTVESITPEPLTDPYDGITETERRPITRALSPASFATVPRGASAYAKAKRADLLGNLTEAEQLFREEIVHHGSFKKSAIMDLASLLTRLERPDEAIDLLTTYSQAFANGRAIDNHLATTYMKAMRYREAAAVWRRLQQGGDNRSRLHQFQQEAYCYFALGEYGRALSILESIKRSGEDNPHITSLIERVRAAQSAGVLGKDAREALAAELSAFSYGLSQFDLAILSTCEYRMVDERSRARGFFDAKDFEVIQRHFDGLRGRRPREKGDCLLTLAAMAQKNPEAAGERTSEHYLVRALTFMGEAALYERLHPDTARSFLAEALRHFATERNLEHPLCLLLMTYLTAPPDPSDWAQEGHWQIERLLALFAGDHAGWQKVLSDIPYYDAMFSRVSAHLGRHALRFRLAGPQLTDVERARRAASAELNRLQDELGNLRTMAAQFQTQGSLHEIAAGLRSLASTTRFSLDRERYLRLSSCLEMAPSYFNERDYSEKENKVRRLLAALQDIAEELQRMPTKIGLEGFREVVVSCREFLKGHFREFEAIAVPSLDLINVLEQDYYLPTADGILRMTLSLTSKAGGAPIEGIDLVVSEDEGAEIAEPCHSAEVLRGGQSRELELYVRPSAKHLMEKAFTLRAHLQYRLRSGVSTISEWFSLPVRIGTPGDFVPIPNPYGQYSGGKPIADPHMFYGRRDLLSRIVRSLADEPHGECFVVYGQKRSGKTSLLEQVRQKLEAPVFATYVTLGAVGTVGAEANFVRECVDGMYQRLVDDFLLQPTDWPARGELKDAPQASLFMAIRSATDTLRRAGWLEPKIVLLIDEFTYLYEYITEGILPRHFMHFWKSLLDRRSFSALVVGQDSMPKFIREFPNDFGVTREERINYLTETEARALADEPIQLSGSTRYRGSAMQRLMTLTAGGPYYLQIFCDRLVRHLNHERAVFITEADVDIVNRRLVSGNDALASTVFDPLISAAGDSVAEANREVYLRLLKLIALQSERSGSVSVADEPGLSGFEHLLQDMKERDVIAVDSAGRLSIRVGLFAEWLRVNRGII